MIRKSGGLVVVLAGLTLCVAAFFFWYSIPGQRESQDSRGQDDERIDGREPITPIPLELRLDKRKVALGRRLFYDPQFSHDSKISCSTCHDLAKGGADGLPFPIGIGKKPGKINTLSVFNSGFNFRLFWDGRVVTLEDQIEFPLQHSAAMSATWPEVIAKLEKDTAYRRDFAAIYPKEIKPANVKDALATFERSLITLNAKFDRYLRGDLQALDHDELAGYELFKKLGCISCHQGRNVGGNMYEKLGVVGNYFVDRGNVQEADFGRYNITGNEDDRYEFRVPSLRNVALTAPYFHDASAGTLEQAVHTMGKYQLGVDLSGDEITKLVKFLNTLTGIYDEKLMSGQPQGETGK